MSIVLPRSTYTEMREEFENTSLRRFASISKFWSPRNTYTEMKQENAFSRGLVAQIHAH